MSEIYNARVQTLVFFHFLWSGGANLYTFTLFFWEVFHGPTLESLLDSFLAAFSVPFRALGMLLGAPWRLLWVLVAPCPKEEQSLSL